MRFFLVLGALLFWSAGAATGFAYGNSDPGHAKWATLAAIDLVLGVIALARVWIKVGRH